jgi:hypothetical protein
MGKIRPIGTFILFVVLPGIGSVLSASTATLAVDRGLPQVNLNNVSGPSRSNVRWANDEDGFLGDDFTLGAPGEIWVIDAIRTWTVPQIPVTSSMHLGDLYQDVRLYFGSMSDPAITPIVSTTLKHGTDEADSNSVKIREETGAIAYDDRGTSLRIWQLEFRINTVVSGGEKYAFGVWGMGRSVSEKGATEKSPELHLWFNHASNAPLSAARQDGADGLMLMFDGAGRFKGTFDSNGSSWDKSSDINVQVLAHRVSPSAQ